MTLRLDDLMRTVNGGVLSQHVDEAALYWLRRDTAVRAPHFSLRTLGILEGRLEGHLDGLRIAGEAGWEYCRKELTWKEPGEVFTAGVLAFEGGAPTRIDAVVGIAMTAPELARALASSLGWLIWNSVHQHAETLAIAEWPLARRAGIAAYALHRKNPEARLNSVLTDDDAIVRARALRAVGELARKDLHVAAKEGLADSDETCRFWAACSLTLLGDHTAREHIRATAEMRSPLAERAALLAASAMPLGEALAWQRYLAADKNKLRSAARVAGAIGDTTLIPWLIDQMSVPALARVAGGAFTNITDIDLTYHDVAGRWPSGFETGPNDDSADDNVAMDPDEYLPFPDPRRVADWWVKNRHSFSSGVRYLTGKPITTASLEDVLRKGRQRQRAAAALELTLLEPGRPLFEVRAPAAWQCALLGI
jgi:uncharacterized protein (TIGR02270 family)